MRSQIARIREKCRVDGIDRGGVVLVGDRTRAKLVQEMWGLRPGAQGEAEDYDGFSYWGQVTVCGVSVEHA